MRPLLRQLLVLPLLLALCLFAPPSGAYHVCVVDVDRNPRTGSLFRRNTLEEFGSKHRYSVVSSAHDSPDCDSSSVWVRRVRAEQIGLYCGPRDICIVTSDETCKAPADVDVVASGGSDSKRRRKRRPKSNSEKKLTVTGITNKNQNKTTTSAVIAIAVGLSFACTYHTET